MMFDAILVPLKYLIITQKGVKPMILKKTPFLDSVPYLDISALETGIIREYTHRELGALADGNDILVVWDGSRSGLAFKGIAGAIGSTLMGLTPICILPEYLFFFIKAHFRLINDNTSGSSIPHVDSDIFYDLKLPLLSLENQKKFVDNLEKKFKTNEVLLENQKHAIKNMLSEVEIPFEQEDNIFNSIQNFRDAVISHAISGLITSEWRKKNRAEINELPEELHIKNSQIEDWNVTETWKFAKLSAVIDSFSYGTSEKSDETGLVPVLRMGNIRENKLDWQSLKYTSSANEIEKYRLNKGDILFNRTNSPELVGKTAVYDHEQPAIFAGYLIRLSPKKYMNPYFLSYCLNSLYAKRYYASIIIGSASQANISASRLGEFFVPIAPLEEQNEIVRIVEKLLTIADRIESNYDKSLLHFRDLDSAFLQDAFEQVNILSEGESAPLNQLLKKIQLEKRKAELQKVTTMKKKLKEKRTVTNKLTQKRSIIEILEDIKAIPTEELWRESKYYDSRDVERFYLELSQLKEEGKIKMEFGDPEKSYTNIILRNNAN